MEKVVFERTKGLADVPMRYCPGCGHGVVHRLVAECFMELGVQEKTIGIGPVGCSVFADEYFNVDMIQGAHGRGPAIATGIKRCLPDRLVFSYQGDGDLASIGAAEMLHSAMRSENITIIFINNAIYGMTGGQMAPTTMPGQVATTCQLGRDVESAGHPIRIAELISTLRTPAFVARATVHNPLVSVHAKEMLRRAFTYQVEGTCFSLVEVLSTCPTNWGIPPAEATGWLEKNMLPYYPVGIFKTPEGGSREPKPLVD